MLDMTPYRRCWQSMKDREGVNGRTISREFQDFDFFQVWMRCQPWQGRELDKDLIVPGNKEYGPKTCCFITGKLNEALVIRGTTPRYFESYCKRLLEQKSSNQHVARHIDNYVATVRRVVEKRLS